MGSITKNPMKRQKGKIVSHSFIEENSITERTKSPVRINRIFGIDNKERLSSIELILNLDSSCSVNSVSNKNFGLRNKMEPSSAKLTNDHMVQKNSASQNNSDTVPKMTAITILVNSKVKPKWIDTVFLEIEALIARIALPSLVPFILAQIHRNSPGFDYEAIF